MLQRRLRTVLLAAAGATVVAAGTTAVLVAHAASTGCTVGYTIATQWNVGFTANVAITNLGDPVKGWTLRWSYSGGQTVTQAWSAAVAQSGSSVTATNAGWNAAIPTNGTVSFRFNGAYRGATNPAPTSFSLNGVTCTGQLGSTPSASPSVVVPTTTAPDPTPTATATGTATASPTASPTDGTCGRQAAAGPAVTVTDVNVGVPVTGYGGEGDTEPLPMAIAAAPNGASWLAWLGADGKVYLGKLGCDDKLVGSPTSFEGIDLQDVQADSTGGVLLLTRTGDCHTGPLCGGTSSPCKTMWMVRFDNAGNTVWERQVTNLSDTLGGYDNGARFVWWYQHHGRLASDGSTYAAYFGVAITVQNGSCVDIHEGDRMQVVNASGSLVSGHDSFEVGCSHAWTSRMVWDPRTGHYVMVCATDNGCRIAQPNPYRTVAAGTCDGTLFGGDLVLAATQGYWTAWSQGGKARLEHFTTGASDTTLNTSAQTSHPHLTGYGSGRMLLAWESGSAMAAQVYDAGSGAAVGSQFTINVKDHDYLAFKAYADGSVAYPAAGSTSTSIRIARVLPLS